MSRSTRAGSLATCRGRSKNIGMLSSPGAGVQGLASREGSGTLEEAARGRGRSTATRGSAASALTAWALVHVVARFCGLRPYRLGPPACLGARGPAVNDVPRSEQRYRDAQPARRQRPGGGGGWPRGRAAAPWRRRFVVLIVRRPHGFPLFPSLTLCRSRMSQSTRVGSLTTCRGRSKDIGMLSPQA